MISYSLTTFLFLTQFLLSEARPLGQIAIQRVYAVQLFRDLQTPGNMLVGEERMLTKKNL